MGAPEPELESAEELYENAPCGYVSARPDGTLLRVNATLERWLGKGRAELIPHRRLQDLLAVGSRMYFETHAGPLLRMQGEVHELQMDLEAAGGKTLPVLVSIVEKRDAAGAPQWLRCTLFNMTDRKRYERELLEERRAAERRSRCAALSAEVARSLAQRRDVREQLDACARALVQHLEALEVRIWLGSSEDNLRLESRLGPSVEESAGARLALPDREARGMSQPAPLFLGPEELGPTASEAWLRREGVRAAAILPLVTARGRQGLLALYRREPLDPESRQALVSTAQELSVSLARAMAEAERDGLLEQTRLQAEEVKRSQELLATTLRSIGDAVVATDAKLRLTFLNPVAEQLTGWPASEALGKPLAEVFRILHESTRATVESPLDKALRTGTVVTLANHTLLIRRDGSELPIDDSAAPIRAEDGTILGGVLVFRDISDQHRREHQLRQAQLQLRTVVRNAPLVLFSLDPAGKLVLAEGKGLATEGLAPFNHPGRSVEELSAQAPWLLGELRRALSGESFVGGGRMGELLVETHYAPALDEGGQFQGVVGLLLDVSERGRLEAAVRKTVEFEQQLIGIVSHDLRNPVAAILMGAGMLLRRADSLDASALRSVARIQASADRAQRLIRDLLDFTQARLGGGIPLNPTPLDLAGVVRSVLEEVQAGFPERVLVFEPRGNLKGRWDGDRLAQVVTNLATNALKYGAPDSPVTVSLREEGEDVRLAVHNLGPTIAPELLEELFLPMRRASVAPDAARSVGLGLYIVKHIVEAHHGTVQVRSSAAEGTTFTVTLPRDAPERVVAAQ